MINCEDQRRGRERTEVSSAILMNCGSRIHSIWCDISSGKGEGEEVRGEMEGEVEGEVAADLIS